MIFEEIAESWKRRLPSTDWKGMKSPPCVPREPLQLLSVVIPAGDE
jgi:hypothetical protein